MVEKKTKRNFGKKVTEGWIVAKGFEYAIGCRWDVLQWNNDQKDERQLIFAKYKLMLENQFREIRLYQINQSDHGIYMMSKI